MERLDYASLARAVDAPMKRWWKRTGWWWLLIPLVSLIHTYHAGYEMIRRTTATLHNHSSGLTAKIFHCAGAVIEALTLFSMLLVWLWAVGYCCNLIRNVLRDSTTPISINAVWFMFITGLRQGVFPVLAFTVYCTLTRFVSIAGNAAGNNQLLMLRSYTHSNYLIYGLDGGFHIISAGIWLVAIVVLLKNRQVLAWALAIATLALPGLAFITADIIAFRGDIDLSQRLTTGSITGQLDIWFFAGVVLLPFLVLALVRRWNWAAWTTLTFLIAGTVAEILNALAEKWIIRVDPATTPWLAQVLKLDSIVSMLGLVPCGCRFFFDGTENQTSLLLFGNAMKLGSGLSLISYLVINVLWICLVYWIVSQFMLRTPKSSKHVG